MKRNTLSYASYGATALDNTYSFHSATILTHTIACLHNLYSSQKQNIVVPKMMIFTNFKNSHKINKNSCTTMHVCFFCHGDQEKIKEIYVDWVKKKIGALVTLYCNLNFIFIITLAIYLYCSSKGNHLCQKPKDFHWSILSAWSTLFRRYGQSEGTLDLSFQSVMVFQNIKLIQEWKHTFYW